MTLMLKESWRRTTIDIPVGDISSTEVYPPRAKEEIKQTTPSAKCTACFMWVCRQLAIPRIYAFLGVFGAGLAGFLTSCFVIVFASIIDGYASIEEENIRAITKRWCIFFLFVAAGGFLGYYLQIALLGQCADRMVANLRIGAYRSLWSKAKKNGVRGLPSAKRFTATLMRQSSLLHGMVNMVSLEGSLRRGITLWSWIHSG